MQITEKLRKHLETGFFHLKSDDYIFWNSSRNIWEFMEKATWDDAKYCEYLPMQQLKEEQYRILLDLYNLSPEEFPLDKIAATNPEELTRMSLEKLALEEK